MVILRNAVDTWTTESVPGKILGNTARLHAKTQAGSTRYGWFFFSRPWPPGSTIVSAHLRIYGGDAHGTSTTVSAQRPSSKWGVNTIKYNNQPGVTGASGASHIASLTKATAAAGEEWDIDVTALVQASADGAAWFGFRLSSSSTTDHWWHSQQSAQGNKRPVLEVTWSMPPEAPDGLAPAQGRATSLAKPVVRSNFVDVDGANTMQAMQVQIDAANNFASGIDFDSGTVGTSVPQVDLNTTAYAGLAADATTYWRCRVQDSANVWSAWSDSESFVRKTKGTLTITSPAASPNNYFWEGSPNITWTFTGRTQRAYRVVVAPNNDANNPVFDSGKVSSSATTVGVPFGAIKDASLTYLVTVQVWDTENRESTPGDTAWVEATRTATFNYDSAVAEVTALVVTADPIYPKAVLTWTRTAGQPDFWQIQRSIDGTTWTYVDEKFGADLFVSGSNYTYTDNKVPTYVTQYWRVLAVVAGIQSGDNPVVSGMSKRIAPILMREDGTDPVVLFNATRSRQYLDLQTPHDVLGSSKPVVITQKIGGLAGHAEGRFANDVIAGVSAKDMSDRFKRMRLDPGVALVFCDINETIKVVAFNMNIEPEPGNPSDITYKVAFDWVETD